MGDSVMFEFNDIKLRNYFKDILGNNLMKEVLNLVLEEEKVEWTVHCKEPDFLEDGDVLL